MGKDIRNIILNALSTPATVTELKKRTPNIKSFGSIAYHLKKLENKGIVTKKADTTKRGHPTTYILNKDMLLIINEEKKRREKGMRVILEKIKQKPYITDNELTTFINQSGIDYLLEDDIFETINNNLSTICFKLTPKGEKFIKGHSK